MSGRCAVLIPVAPGEVETARLRDLLDSLRAWERDIGWCVLIDDGVTDRHLHTTMALEGATTISLRNPRPRADERKIRPLGPGVLTGLAYLQRQTDASLVFKIDTDALAVAPFVERVSAFAAADPEAGMIGTIGDTCNPARATPSMAGRAPLLLRALETFPEETARADPAAIIEVPGFGVALGAQMSAFQRVRRHVANAVAHGYSAAAYVQGGAYAVTRVMLDRMAAERYFDDLRAWSAFSLGEDVLISMYASAVALRLRAFCGEGEPFGIQNVGLPYEPAQMLRRGYSLIHSVRNDPDHAEADIRAFFARRRPAFATRTERTLT